MLKRRLIPILYLKDGWMVRSESFEIHQVIGDPVSHVKRMMEWNVDELIVIDISSSKNSFMHNRSDYKSKPVKSLEEFIALIAIECGLPLSLGGGIRSFEDAQLRIRYGADKIVLNKVLFADQKVVKECVKNFGSQSVMASIDYKLEEGREIVYIDKGRKSLKVELLDWIEQICDLGVGEVLINSIDRDGKAIGYDINCIEKISLKINVPLIACGGAGHQMHFLNVFQNTKASGVAAGNIFHFKENAYPLAKNFLKKKLDYIR